MPTRKPRKSAADKAKMKHEIDAVLTQSRTSHALVYHDLGADSARWPSWLRAFAKSCGAYVIRDKRTHHVLYVGSSRSRLYDTVTRHFQQWKRRKNWWKGMHGAHHDPGMVYNRSHCEVAIRLVACGTELDEESRLIHRLHPRDNLVENPDGDEAPF